MYDGAGHGARDAWHHLHSRNHQLAKLVKDSRAMSNSRPAFYFTLTVAGGAVHHIQEDKTFNAC